MYKIEDSKVKNRKRFIKALKPKTLKKINTNKAIEYDYIKKLQDFSDEIFNSLKYWTNATVNKSKNKNLAKQLQFNFNQLYDEWDKKAAKFARIHSNKLVTNVSKYVNAKIASQDSSFRFKRVPKELRQAQIAMQDRNYNLIRSIPKEILERFQSTFLNNVSNFDKESINKQLDTIKGIGWRRARTIGRDQTQKATTQYDYAYQQALGINAYVWITAQDERVSTGVGGHKYLDNRIYLYDKPTAVIDSYRNVGIPSQRPNCRCVAVGIIIAPNQKLMLVPDKLRGDYYILVEK